MTYRSIDRTIERAECLLSQGARFPIIGTLAGLAKVLMGVAQTVAAIVYGVLAFIPVMINGDRQNLRWAGMHITHGLGNIVAGTIETIPIFQTLLFAARKCMERQRKNIPVYIGDGQETKFISYSSLLAERWSVEGRQLEAVQAVQKMVGSVDGTTSGYRRACGLLDTYLEDHPEYRR